MEKTLFIVTLLGVLATALGSGGAVGGGSSKAVQGQSGGTESTKLLRPGFPMVLQCSFTEADDVKVELDWYKDDILITDENDRYKVFQDNSSLVIFKSNQDDVGMYRCQTVEPTAPKSFNQSIVFLTFKNMPKSMTVLEGDKLYLNCDVEGKPMPIITWLKDGVSVEEAVNNTRFSLKENSKGTDNATYLVQEAIYDDRAEYACVISTADIQYNTTTYVRIKDMYAALWPFLGICAEVFVLCLIIFIYEKRRAKNDFEESDTDQPPDQKNTSDQNKDSVRQRK